MFGIFRLEGKGLACAVVLWALGVVAVPLAAAASTARETPPILAGTAWRLVEFQSMDDATGTVRPQDSSLYTMRLHGDSTVQMRLNCNLANGS